MSNIITNKISNMVLTKEIDATKTAQLMYIDFDQQDTGKRNTKAIRDLKLGELVDGENNSEEIEILENDTTYLPEGELNLIAPSVRTFNTTLTKKIKLPNTDSIPIVNDTIQKLILKEVYKTSKKNRKHISHLNNIFDTDVSKLEDTNKARKILSKLLMAANYIASEGRVGPGNVAIMNWEYAYFLTTMLNQSIYKDKDELKLTSLTIIIDDTLKDKMVVLRKPSDISQISNNIFLLHHYDESRNTLFYSIDKIGNCNSNYIEVNITGFDS